MNRFLVILSFIFWLEGLFFGVFLEGQKSLDFVEQVDDRAEEYQHFLTSIGQVKKYLEENETDLAVAKMCEILENLPPFFSVKNDFKELFIIEQACNCVALAAQAIFNSKKEERIYASTFAVLGIMLPYYKAYDQIVLAATLALHNPDCYGKYTEYRPILRFFEPLLNNMHNLYFHKNSDGEYAFTVGYINALFVAVETALHTAVCSTNNVLIATAGLLIFKELFQKHRKGYAAMIRALDYVAENEYREGSRIQKENFDVFFNSCIQAIENSSAITINQTEEFLEDNVARIFSALGYVTNTRLQCPICFEDKSEQVILKQLPCGHIVCCDCLDSYFKRSLPHNSNEVVKSCPMCKTNLSYLKWSYIKNIFSVS